MIVSELIELLKECDQDAYVFVEKARTEGGYCFAGNPSSVEAVLNVNNELYESPHEDVPDDESYKNNERVKAVIL